ncbi:hypothetical protein JI435_036640 [Parastagonospora nodorum SN15]|uniref:Uncharacterized protein n=1 Tax=Phaeosphaeria nodorum (strain SN15 / ATCC MYA-4574 / FGSC 10173) TaxID=321614 RepID=A0A7U2EV42_PHANO|nr:hypothetical protein HBI32_046840 [Parastagonospora nodorum]KAH6024184.1 hypothetical protein HBI83_075670 [Parastagonospora nodorum]QRC93437.1 hypothetical protein JI435_036640 [Parastagonospora nodorum SN15]
MTSILKSSITAIQLNYLEHQPPSHRFINHVECHQGHDLSLTFNSFSWSSPASAPPPCNATTSNKLLHFFSSLAGGFGSGQTGLLRSVGPTSPHHHMVTHLKELNYSEELLFHCSGFCD